MVRAICFTVLCSVLSAQIPAFEVASVRPAAPRTGGGNASNSGDTITLRNTTLLNALVRAYEVKFGGQIDGPAWIRSERYDILAKAPENASKEQIPSMLRQLLIERFHLDLHHETRELAAYVLSAGLGRLQLREGTGESKNSFDMNGGRQARSMTMSAFAQYLSMTLRAPVVDETELRGAYDFPFEQSAEELSDTSGEKPSIFTIVEGLGLKLRARKVAFEVIVVDGGNKIPSAN